MENIKVVTMPYPEKQKTPTVIKTVAVLYILTAFLAIALTLFFSALSSWGGVSNITTAFNWEIITGIGLLVLTIIEAWGLFKQRFWAKIFGIVLGILFYIPIFFIGKNFTFQIVWNPLLSMFPFPIFAIIYLAIPHTSVNWENRGKKSVIIAIILSLLGLGLVATHIQAYYKYALPEYQQRDTQD
jgi:hypothetical protein